MTAGSMRRTTNVRTVRFGQLSSTTCVASGCEVEKIVAMAKRESIAARLRRLRIERGLSQRDLSSPGVSYAYISRIEAGARRPSVKALRQLARKLGVSVEYLETGSDLRDVDERELRLADAELKLRLVDDPAAARATIQEILDGAVGAGDTGSALRARIALGLAEAGAG